MGRAEVRLSRAAILLPAALFLGGVGAGPAHAEPTHAGACVAGHGVSVTVEPGSLGGAARTVCEPDGGGRSAATLFGDAGWPLTRVGSQPSFVCRVAGQPASASCAHVPPANAYWALWWSDGHSAWVYSSLGVDSLTVPDGGAVAFTWVDGSGDGTPTTPPAPTPATQSSNRGNSTPQPRQLNGGGLPGWVAPVVVVAVVGAAGGTALARRRR